MNTATPERLRPMTDTERAATDLFDELVAGGKTVEEAMTEICDLTGLPRAQIAAAVELKDKFGALLQDVEDKPKQQKTPTVPANGKTTAKPKPAVMAAAPPPPEGKTAEPAATSDIEALLTAAENSPQPRARELAAETRRAIAAIRQILDNDEKVRVLTASIGVLRRQLADDEAELEKLLGTRAVAPAPEAAVEKPAAEAVPADAGEPDAKPENGRDPLEYSPDVRTWAIAEGWQVGTSGRIAAVVVNAYRKAHPGT